MSKEAHSSTSACQENAQPTYKTRLIINYINNAYIRMQRSIHLACIYAHLYTLLCIRAMVDIRFQ